jgi:hypothetical protein
MAVGVFLCIIKLVFETNQGYDRVTRVDKKLRLYIEVNFMFGRVLVIIFFKKYIKIIFFLFF